MKKQKGRFWIVLGIALIIAAALLAVWNLYDAFRAGRAAHESADALLEMIVPAETTAVPQSIPEMEKPLMVVPGETIAPAPGASQDALQTMVPSSSPSVQPAAEPDAMENAEAVAAMSTSAGVSMQDVPGMIQGESAMPQDILQMEQVHADYLLVPEMDMPVQNYKGQEYIGILEIPVLELKLPVISEWNYDRLKIAPCRYTGSAYMNNLVISAHNYKAHFGSLKQLEPMDRVIFTDVDGNRFEYRVEGLETLGPREIDAMVNSGWDLTLFTCTLGGSYRLAVRCSRG